MSPFAHLRNKKTALLRCSEALVSTKMIAGMMMLILALGISYIAKTNGAAGSGYAMRELDRSIRSLEHETQQLELRIATKTSSKQLRQRAATIGLQRQSEVRFISASAPAVALR